MRIKDILGRAIDAKHMALRVYREISSIRNPKRKRVLEICAQVNLLLTELVSIIRNDYVGGE